MNIHKKQPAVTLLIAILILSTILAISFSLATILLAESRNGGDLLRTEPSFYADNGISEEAIFNIRRSTGITSYSAAVGSLAVNSSSTPLNDPVQTVKIPSTNTAFGCGVNCYALYNPANPYAAGGYGRIQVSFLNTNTVGAHLNIYLCQWDPVNPPKNSNGTYKNVCSNPSDSSYMTFQNTSPAPLTPGQTWDTNSNCGGCMDATGNKQQELILYQSNGTPATDIYAQITTYDSSGNPMGVPYFGQTAVTLNSSNSGVSRDIKVVVPTGSSGSGGSANGFAHSRAITINAGQVPSSQTNFPVLVAGTYSYLQYNNNGGNPTGEVQTSSGNDIIFTSDSAGNTVLPYEQEKYVSATGEIAYWVKLPTVAVGTTFYMFYDKAGAVDQSNGTGVWDSNYKGVWHLPNGSVLSANDSTLNGNNGILTNSPTAVTGKIDGGANFNGSSYITTSGGISLTGLSTLTISAWVNASAFQSSWPFISMIAGGEANGSTDNAFIRFGDAAIPDNELQMSLAIGGTSVKLNGSVSYSTGTWYYVVGTYDGATMKLYSNGTLDTSTSQTGSITSSAWDIARSAQSGRYLTGSEDEVRVSSIARSSDWIKTEYNDQSNPTSFYSIGPEQ